LLGFLQKPKQKHPAKKSFHMAEDTNIVKFPKISAFKFLNIKLGTPVSLEVGGYGLGINEVEVAPLVMSGVIAELAWDIELHLLAFPNTISL
jgi:hypothetical protein